MEGNHQKNEYHESATNKVSTLYCDKTNVNQLTALMKSHDIRNIVVCPGSRNSVLVHNFSIEPFFNVHSIIDERSAGFVALGIATATQEPCAICVTSGSAVLNLYPAVAEAFYRHIPLLVISADRPAQWIGQMDGQTLPQAGVFANLNIPTFQLTEAEDKERTWWNNCQINKVLLDLEKGSGCPQHINIPISEPLFSFTTPSLPQERAIYDLSVQDDFVPEEVLELIRKAKFPVLLIGQLNNTDFNLAAEIEESNALLVLPEQLANIKGAWRNHYLEQILPLEDFNPDLIVHIGGNLVNKKLKIALRNTPNTKTIRIGEEMVDTFCNTICFAKMDGMEAIRQLGTELRTENPMVKAWKEKLNKKFEMPDLPFSDALCMIDIAEWLEKEKVDFVLHAGNSQPIRNVQYCFNGYQQTNHPIFCNRGVNGIEGSLSTAVGYATTSTDLVLCFIGDLSFFYDQNALWDSQLPANLRIIMFNNGGGQIFKKLPGLQISPACKAIAGINKASAFGIAETFHIEYHSVAHDEDELFYELSSFFDAETDKPKILEIFTDSNDNMEAETALKKAIVAQLIK